MKPAETTSPAAGSAASAGSRRTTRHPATGQLRAANAADEEAWRAYPCDEWTGKRDKDGYGYFYHKGRTWSAHRLAWETRRGPIPKGLHVLHRCDNPPCWEVRHLFLGTQADNNRDMVAKGRNSAKLTAAEVTKIRKRYAEGGVTQQQLAAEYGVGQQEISRIVRGINWRHLEDQPAPVRQVRLSAGQAAEIRERYRRGRVTQQQLALEHGVGQEAIGRIIRGLSWRAESGARDE